MPKISSKSSSSFGTAVRLKGLQYRHSDGLGKYIDGIHREFDKACKELEDEIAGNSDAQADLIKKGVVQVANDENQKSTATGLGNGAWTSKAVILQRIDSNGALAAGLRVTGIVNGNGDLLVRVTNAAGDLINAGVDLTLNWAVDGR